MTKLALRRCTPVKKGSKPISPGIARSLLNQVNNKWRLDGQAKFIERDFDFADFRRAIEFVNAVAWVANGQDHHPELEINHNRCKVRYSTHAAGGLTVNDFICAAKIDALFGEERLKSISSAPKRPHPASPAAVEGSSSAGIRESATEDNIKLSKLSLDSKEVEELLNKKLPDEEEEATTQDAADEFELLDPEVIRPPEPPQEAPPPPQQASQPATATTKESPAIVENPHAELDLTSTVILPPGMQVVGKKPEEEEEDATVILPEDTVIDPEETVIGSSERTPGLPPASPSPAAKEDDDEVKTVIMNPSLASAGEETVIQPPVAATVSNPNNPRPFPSSAAVTLPPVSPKTDDEEDGTMILSSNPLNHPDSKIKTPVTAKATQQEAADGQNKANEKQQAPAAPQKPDSDGNETDYMGTMIMSAAEVEAITRAQTKPAPPTPPKKVDEDDTLVMHVNDFKKLKNDQ